MTDAAKIVIVGGGVAGVEVATKLGRRLGRQGTARVTLVDRSLSHFWKPMLHTFAAGTSRPDMQKVRFLAQAKDNGFRFKPGNLIGVDRDSREVLLAPFDQTPEGEPQAPVRLAYDRLVIAVGSRANDFGTPGVVDHCLTIDDLAGAETFQARLRKLIFTTVQTGRDLRVAIVGGGATGVELAAELKQAFELLSAYGEASLREKLRLTLIESGSRLLPAFPEAVSKAAAATLADLSVDLEIGPRVVAADAAGFVLNSNRRIDADLMVWAAGVKAPAVLQEIHGLETSRTGQLVVGPTLQTTRDPDIFALGDCASLQDPSTGRPVPATAQAAHQQALHLGRHVGRHDTQELPPFRYRDEGSIVALAHYNGWGTLGRYTFGGGPFRGFSARCAHELLYRQHQFELSGPLRGAVGWLADRLDGWISPPVKLD